MKKHEKEVLQKDKKRFKKLEFAQGIRNPRTRKDEKKHDISEGCQPQPWGRLRANLATCAKHASTGSRPTARTEPDPLGVKPDPQIIFLGARQVAIIFSIIFSGQLKSQSSFKSSFKSSFLGNSNDHNHLLNHLLNHLFEIDQTCISIDRTQL